jgi:hypothetical protein
MTQNFLRSKGDNFSRISRSCSLVRFPASHLVVITRATCVCHQSAFRPQHLFSPANGSLRCAYYL